MASPWHWKVTWNIGKTANEWVEVEACLASSVHKQLLFLFFSNILYLLSFGKIIFFLAKVLDQLRKLATN